MATEYLVHGADLQSGRNVRKIVEADSANDAERTAQNLGILVTGVEGTPSHWTNASADALCALFFCLVIPIFVAAYFFLKILTTKYTLTNQRLRKQKGILTKRIEEIERALPTKLFPTSA